MHPKSKLVFDAIKLSISLLLFNTAIAKEKKLKAEEKKQLSKGYLEW